VATKPQEKNLTILQVIPNCRLLVELERFNADMDGRPVLFR